MKPLDLSAFEGHTPGPWTLESHQNAFRLRHEEETVIAPDTTGEVLLGESADLALIAAAPTLLAYALEAREVLREINEAYLDDEIHALPGPIKRRLAALLDTEAK